MSRIIFITIFTIMQTANIHAWEVKFIPSDLGNADANITLKTLIWLSRSLSVGFCIYFGHRASMYLSDSNYMKGLIAFIACVTAGAAPILAKSFTL